MQRVIGREDFSKDGGEVENAEHNHGELSQLVPAELPPYQLPLSGAKKCFILLSFLFLAILAQGQFAVFRGQAGYAHDASIPPKRMQGSITASSRSETRLPMVVSKPTMRI